MLVTEVEQMTLVVEYVKERLLVAALKETAEICGEKKRAEGEEGGSGSEGGEKESVGSGGAGGEEEGEQSGGEGGGSSVGTAAGGRAQSESSGTAAEGAGGEGLSKLQILKLKTEGLRDALRVDLKDFRMPETFT